MTAPRLRLVALSCARLRSSCAGCARLHWLRAVAHGCKGCEGCMQLHAVACGRLRLVAPVVCSCTRLHAVACGRSRLVAPVMCKCTRLHAFACGRFKVSPCEGRHELYLSVYCNCLSNCVNISDRFLSLELCPPNFFLTFFLGTL